MNTKKKILMALALVGCAVLLVAGSIAGTLAYLTAQTDPITNTFTVGDIEITLSETTTSYKIVPGTDISKDPKVTVLANSEACYLFVKIVETNNTFGGGNKFVTYTIADGWTELAAGTGVYYRAVDATNADTAYAVLKDNKVVSNSAAGSADLENAETNAPTLTFTAYAIQQAGFTNVNAAWTASGFGN